MPKKKQKLELSGSPPVKLTETKFFREWHEVLKPADAGRLWRKFKNQKDLPALDFSFEVSAVFSANIEGNSVDLNAFANSKFDPALAKFRRKEIAEINALIEAYQFARSHRLNEKNLLAAHALATKTILPKPARGRYRTTQVFVLSQAGVEYAALEPEFVAEKMSELLSDAKQLLKSTLSTNKTFYHAALLHLIFAHVHPFSDGNGRIARLLEKWFLAELLGEEAWHIPSEKYYREHLNEYYRNIKLGPNYYLLNYDRCIDFLMMLVRCLSWSC